MNYLIINEQHQLMPEQVEILAQQIGKYHTLKIPASGLTRSQLESFTVDNGILYNDTIIFASPIPYLIKLLSSQLTLTFNESIKHSYNVLIFHNDTREKKELPNGKVIMTVAQTGWELI
jgi:hypothetical protein